MYCQVEKQLIPLKAHYFLTNCVIGAMMPYLPTYARQLGFTSVAVGLMGTVQAMAGLFIRPMAGFMADRFIRQKSLILASIVIVAAAFVGIHLVKMGTNVVTFERSWANGSSILKYCQTLEPFNECLLNQLRVQRTSNEMQCSIQCNGSDQKAEIVIDLNTIQQNDYCLHFSILNSTSSISDDSIETCRANCSNSNIMYLLASNQAETRLSLDFDLSYWLWLFVLFNVVTSAGIACIFCLTNAWCYTILNDRPHLFGQQHLWGSFGWGCISLVAGGLVDVMSRGQVLKDYSGVFYVLIGFAGFDLIAVWFVQDVKVPRTRTVLTSVGSLLRSPRIIVFILWLSSVGFCMSIMRNFHFWFLEELGESNLECAVDGASGLLVDHSKTLQGLASMVQTFGGEIPMLIVAGSIIQRFGHVHVMSVVLGTFGLRFMLYSLLADPWLTLPIELLQGLTVSLFFTAMTSYANEVAPKGTATTVQGLAGATYQGVGYSLGSVIGGCVVQRVGCRIMFRWMGCAALGACGAHVAAQLLLAKFGSVQRNGTNEAKISMGELGRTG